MKNSLLISIILHALLIALLIQNNYRMSDSAKEKVYIVDLISLPLNIPVSDNIITPLITPLTAEKAEASAVIREERFEPAERHVSSKPRTGKDNVEDLSTGEVFSSEQYISKLREKLGVTDSLKSAGNVALSSVDTSALYQDQKKKSLASRIFPLSTVENSTGSSVGVQSSGLPPGSIIPLDYIENIKSTLQRKWKLPEERNYSLTCAISFRVKRDGTITDIFLETSSGVRSFDESALRAVKEAKKFEPLPTVYKPDYLDITVKFNMRGIE
ncbi:MAG: TonB C-terminal domain-containing protein [Candidatus Omnitrophica bacterium]|nr:TonB C-terminal domain-containing protein [Candidatus Omnitrophota bacterium]